LSRKPPIIDQNLENIPPGHYSDQTFFNCVFRKLNGVIFENCDMNHSRLVATDVRDVLGLTVTLDCKTFENVELSPEMFDAFLCLLCKTKGNDEKRKELLKIIGVDTARKLLRKLRATES